LHQIPESGADAIFMNPEDRDVNDIMHWSCDDTTELIDIEKRKPTLTYTFKWSNKTIIYILFHIGVALYGQYLDNRARRYAAVIQEFFQIRVDIWLETVRKETMGITHYWFCFEFTKGRGQIHAHIIVIIKDIWVIPAYLIARNEIEKMDIISEYAREN